MVENSPYEVSKFRRGFYFPKMFPKYFIVVWVAASDIFPPILPLHHSLISILD
jgi:hypothetical protein